MARFSTRTPSARIPTTTNVAGGTSYEIDAKTELTLTVLSSLLKDTYYESSDKRLERIRGLIPQVPIEYVAKLAVYVRKVYGLRSVSHVLAAEVAHDPRAKGSDWLRRMISGVVKRPDDAQEIVAYTVERWGKPIPNAMKKGLAHRLARFDAYQLGKYKGRGHKVNLYDVVNLVHPPRTEAIDALMNGTLLAPDTWEVALTASRGEDKGAIWEQLVVDDALPYFATLRNLRNIAEYAPQALPLALTKVSDPNQITESLVMPFRYVTASRAVQQAYDEGKITERQGHQIMAALTTAIDHSLSNVPEFSGKTLLAIDGSGSMTWTSSGEQPADNAALFAAAFVKRNPDTTVVVFDNRASVVLCKPHLPVADIAQAIRGKCCGGGTNFDSVFAVVNPSDYDRAIFLTDQETWGHSRSPLGYNPWDEDMRRFEPGYARALREIEQVIIWDLTGYGNLSMPKDKHIGLGGFSDRCFDLLKVLDTHGADPSLVVEQSVLL